MYTEHAMNDAASTIMSIVTYMKTNVTIELITNYRWHNDSHNKVTQFKLIVLFHVLLTKFDPPILSVFIYPTHFYRLTPVLVGQVPKGESFGVQVHCCAREQSEICAESWIAGDLEW